MKKTTSHTIEFESYDDLKDLHPDDAVLVKEARALTQKAYAPYSNFKVAAVARFVDGTTITGTNQENASYPVGSCAERSLLSAAGSVYPDKPIASMAISYDNLRDHQHSDHPLAPCGMCRQALVEFEDRTQHSIRMILSGQDGPIIIVRAALDLLPLAFTGSQLK